MQTIADTAAALRSKLTRGRRHHGRRRARRVLDRGVGPVGIGIGGMVLVVFLSVFIYRRGT